jgi:hypothetical protein
MSRNTAPNIGFGVIGADVVTIGFCNSVVLLSKLDGILFDICNNFKL